jgi:hypothetical protein
MNSIASIPPTAVKPKQGGLRPTPLPTPGTKMEFTTSTAPGLAFHYTVEVYEQGFGVNIHDITSEGQCRSLFNFLLGHGFDLAPIELQISLLYS